MCLHLKCMHLLDDVEVPFYIVQLPLESILKPYIIIIIIIIIKKYRRCKAVRERSTPKQTKDISPTIPTYRKKEKKGKEISRR